MEVCKFPYTANGPVERVCKALVLTTLVAEVYHNGQHDYCTRTENRFEFHSDMSHRASLLPSI
jgi:hypothetical protein